MHSQQTQHTEEQWYCTKRTTGGINRSDTIASTPVPLQAGIVDTRHYRQIFGDNVLISGGQFYQAEQVIHNHSNTGINPFTHLLDHVAPSAFHNSSQRVDPPRCHPNTRIGILQAIHNWIMQGAQDRESWILWLNGAAGAGKSAIMQSIVEQLLLHYHSIVSVAGFFFYRGDSTRNIIDSVVPTLAYQLIQQIPQTSDDILTTIANNPFIFKQSLEAQLRELIIQPLLRIPFYLQRQFVVFIDGLDECLDRSNQANLIKVLLKIFSTKDTPVVFIVASRREPQIEAEFSTKEVRNLSETIPLDDSEASDDIRRFLIAKFKEIKETHLRRKLLPADWPSVSSISEIVEKASGQFIYASVVINYISSPRANPARQLDIIRDLRLHNPSSQHPFTHLDSLYRHILSQVENLDKVLDILAFLIITQSSYAQAFELTYGDLEIWLADLTPVLQLEPDDDGDIEIKFLHASLPDFLQDQFRSQEYFIDAEKYRTKLLCMFLGRPVAESSIYNWKAETDQEFWRLKAIEQLLHRAQPSKQLQSALMKFDSTFHGAKVDNMWRNAEARISILYKLEHLDFKDRGQAYEHVLDMFAAGHAKFWPLHWDIVKEEARKSSDLCSRIRKLRPELKHRPSLDFSQHWRPAYLDEDS